MISRRLFLQGIGAITLSSGFPAGLLAASGEFKTPSDYLRMIPKTGEAIPVIGLGTSRVFHVDITNKKEMQQRQKVLQALLDSGGGMIDSSPMYENAEEVIGFCFDQMDKNEIEKKIFSASKIWSLNTQAGIREYTVSEKQWRENQFDLMQVHNLLNWQEHLKTLQKYKAEGRLRYIGVTTSHKRRHQELLEIMQTQDIDFVQISYSVANRLAEKELLPMAQKQKLGVIINRGFQTGYLFRRVEGQPLPEWASEIEVDSWAQYFLKFIISHPAVTVVIPATSDPAHMLENMQTMRGTMPDEKMRSEMVRYFESVAA